MPQEADDTAPEIDRIADALLSRHPAFLAHERFIRDRLGELARRAFDRGRHAATHELLTTEQAATMLGCSRSQVRRLAAEHRIGWLAGRDWVLRPDDVEQLRALRAAHRPGRPRRA